LLGLVLLSSRDVCLLQTANMVTRFTELAADQVESLFSLTFDVPLLIVNGQSFVEFKAGQCDTLQTEAFILLRLVVNVLSTLADKADVVFVLLDKLSSVFK
jgi:hypothetical protein